MKYDCIRPGKIWLDTKGERIQAHGGSVMYLNGAYFWYGENKAFTDPAKGIWHWGVRCYRSTDLYNWDDLGLIIPPNTENEASGLHPASMMDRPHILYNSKTEKFVCWLKIMEKDGTQSATILTADKLTGPYTVVREHFYPLGMSAGDFDLAADVGGKAYDYFERVHTELICAELTEDYTDVTGVYSSHFSRPYPPYVREAPAHFTHRDKHYLITSGTTYYYPNPSELAVGDAWHGPFTVLGNPHPADPTHTSFHSQISCVFKVEGKKDLYIACADRWMPNAADIRYEDVEKAFVALFSPEASPKEKERARAFAATLPPAKTREADYVWLPFRFDGGMGYLDWKDEWRIEDYD